MALMSTLQDSFISPIDPEKWSESGSGSITVVEDRALQTGSRTLRSVNTYEFDRASVCVDLAVTTDWYSFAVGQDETEDLPWPENRLMYINFYFPNLHDPSTYLIEANWQGYDLGEGFTTSVPPTDSWEGYGGYYHTHYDATEMRYVKMTNSTSGGVLTGTFETSPDGTTWTTFFSFTTTPNDSHGFRASLGGADVVAELRNFNLPLAAVGVMKVKMPDGSWKSDGEVKVKLPSGEWQAFQLQGSSENTLKQKQPDGTWKDVAWG